MGNKKALFLVFLLLASVFSPFAKAFDIPQGQTGIVNLYDAVFPWVVYLREPFNNLEPGYYVLAMDSGGNGGLVIYVNGVQVQYSLIDSINTESDMYLKVLKLNVTSLSDSDTIVAHGDRGDFDGAGNFQFLGVLDAKAIYYAELDEKGISWDVSQFSGKLGLVYGERSGLYVGDWAILVNGQQYTRNTVLQITLQDTVTIQFGDGDYHDGGMFLVVVAYYSVTFNIIDAVTGEALTNVQVLENNTTIATINSADSLEFFEGQYTLALHKDGYRDVALTIDVLSDMSVTIEMYPDPAAFKVFGLQNNYIVYENTENTIEFTIEPFEAVYSAKLKVVGLQNIEAVFIDGQEAQKAGDGSYYIGDVSTQKTIKIVFRAGSNAGQYPVQIILEATDVVGLTQYSQIHTISIDIVNLPFSVILPAEWSVGQNQIRVTEQAGQKLSLVLSLVDSEGNAVWSGSAILQAYEQKKFIVDVPSEGSYELKISFGTNTAVFDINVVTQAELLTKQITVKEGGTGVVQLKLKNPSDLTKYYTIELSGALFGNETVIQPVAIAPNSEKIVEVTFEVPKELEFDAYDINVAVKEGDTVIYQDIVHVLIDQSGFILPVSPEGGDTLYLAVGAFVVLLLIAAVLSRR